MIQRASLCSRPPVSRRLAVFGGAVALACAMACDHEQVAKVSVPPPPATGAAPRDEARVAEYLLAETDARRSTAGDRLDLDHGERGVIMDGRRLVIERGGMRVSSDVTNPPLVAVDPIPGWARGSGGVPQETRGGGASGFLFRSRRSLFASETFDGPLRPIVSFPVDIQSVSFGPTGTLVRAASGQRWMIDLKTGERAPLSPSGVVDIAAAADGRVAAITEGGGAVISSDRGAHWVDVTRELTGRPATVFATQGPGAPPAVWLTQSTGPALRVEPGGHVARVDPPPKSGATPAPPDPRWRGTIPPIRRAIHSGARVDPATALVIVEGDVIELRVSTGEIVSVTPGRLPPGAECEPVRTPDDLLFVCRKSSGERFVVSQVLGGKSPVVEQTFLAHGEMYASDDGGLAFGGPCSRARDSALIVCVRSPGGGWREIDLETPAPDGGPPSTTVPGPFGDGKIARWVPRADGSVLGVVDGKTPGLIDATTWETHVWPLDGLPPEVKSYLTAGHARGAQAEIVDRSWTTTEAGGLRAWLPNGNSFAIGVTGAVTVSPFTFDRVLASGRLGMALVSKGERLWQSVDHGRTWVEVLAPAGRATRSLQLQACSAVGCDLGAWYRVGWSASTPVADVPLTTVANAPLVTRPPLPRLVCKPLGDPRAVSLPRSDKSPEDFGIGAVRLPVSTDSEELVRLVVDRHAVNAAHGASPVGRGADYVDPRALLFGPAVDVQKNVLAARRQIAFVAPFDSGASVKRTSFGAGELVAQGRAVGMRTGDVLGDDPLAVVGMAPVASIDPAATGDLVFFGGTGAVGLLRANPGSRPVLRTAMNATRSDGMEPVSAAALSADDVAILGIDSSGSGQVLKLGPSGVSLLFDVPGPPAPALYPANADAVAVGPHGEVALIRTPSGGDPPTLADPALLMVRGSDPLPLAPWSTLASAEGEECRGDATGYRAIIQTVAPWIALAGTEPEPDDDAPMLARVRWSQKRVCLEAVELRAADTPTFGDVSVETWMVAHLTSPTSAGKVAVAPGTEIRQAMACALEATR